MSSQTEIVANSRVSLHMSLSLPDGTEALSTFGEEPLTLTMGDRTLQPGMELALYGLKAGESQSVTLTAEQGYGPHDPSLIHDMPLGDFPADIQPEPGQIIGFSAPNGDEIPGMILAVGEDQVTVDFNHPLAGKEILFKVEILSVESESFDVESSQ